MTSLRSRKANRLRCRSLRETTVGYRLLIHILALGVLCLTSIALVEQTVLALACLLIFVIFSLVLTAMLLGVIFRFQCCVLGLFRWRGRIARHPAHEIPRQT
jgi:hypothetical protein